MYGTFYAQESRTGPKHYLLFLPAFRLLGGALGGAFLAGAGFFAGTLPLMGGLAV